MASQTSFSSSPPRPKKEYKSVVPVLRGRAKPAPRSLLLWGGGLLPIRATFEKPPFRGPAINLHAKESPVAKTWGKQSGGLYGIGAAQEHLFVLYYQQVERHSGEAIAIARTPNRERRLKTRTPERYPVPDEKCRDALAARGKQRRKKQRCSSGKPG